MSTPIKLSRGSSRIQQPPAPPRASVALCGGYSIELPLPPKGVSPNGRGKHWGAKAKAQASYRAQCAWRMREMKWGASTALTVPVRVHLDFYLCRQPGDTRDYFPMDEDNARASFKAGQDALKDVGVIEQDSKKFLRVGETRLHTTKKEHQGRTCVVLTLEPIEETI